MNYLNIHTDLLRSESYLGAEPVERATWLNLLAWCASQENGGIIPSASEWTDRKWQQLCGVTKEEATLVSDLYQMDQGGNLVVSHYPVEKETEVKTKREVARVNGKKGGRPKKETQKKPTLVNSAKAEGKEKGRERKDKEKNTPAALPHGKEFSESWSDWVQFRKEKRQALKPTTIKQQLKKLGAMTEAFAIASIQNSILQGYTGLFDVAPEDLSKSGNSEPPDIGGRTMSITKASEIAPGELKTEEDDDIPF